MSYHMNAQQQAIRDRMAEGMTELEAVRLELTPKQFNACQCRLRGGTLKDCMKAGMSEQAFDRFYGKKNLDHDSAMQESRVFNYLQRRYLELARAKVEADSLLTAVERRKFIADVVRTPIGDVDGSSPLAQTCETRQLKNGGEATRVTMPDKLVALKLDAELAGDLKGQDNTQQVNIALILGRLPDTSGIPAASVTSSSPSSPAPTIEISAQPVPTLAPRPRSRARITVPAEEDCI